MKIISEKAINHQLYSYTDRIYSGPVDVAQKHTIQLFNSRDKNGNAQIIIATSVSVHKPTENSTQIFYIRLPYDFRVEFESKPTIEELYEITLRGVKNNKNRLKEVSPSNLLEMSEEIVLEPLEEFLPSLNKAVNDYHEKP